jgi:hypothetical protein
LTNNLLILNIPLFKISLQLKNDIELPIPKYFIYERAEAILEKEKLLVEILSHMEPKESKVNLVINL